MLNENLDSVEYRLKMCEKSDYEMLNLSGMSLKKLPNNIPKQIKNLFIDNNLLTEIPDLSDFDKLNTMDCTANMITKIGGLPMNLKEFVCRNNQLTDISILKKSADLERLDISGNIINYIPRLSKLKILICNECELTQLPPLDSIEIIRCRNNRLNSINQNYKYLKLLDCSANQIKQLPFFENLEELMCDCNQIANIPIFPKLYFIHCINNRPIKIIDYLPKLKELKCDFQPMKMSKKFNIIEATKSSKYIKIMFAPSEK